MILITVVDDRMGLCFNHRRLSQDKLLSKKILDITEGKMLWMSTYSSRMFGIEQHTQINVDDDCLHEAAEGEYCFVETEDPIIAEKWIEKIILFHWNRKYPSDIRLTIDLSKWKLSSSEEFAGNSHDKITMEVYDAV